MTSGEIRVLVVDDHPVVRDGVRLALDTREGIAVVGEASSGPEALEAALRLRPDVVAMDLHMPAGDGVRAIKELARTLPEVRCLVLTMDEDDDSLFAAMQAGARGYLLKGAGKDEIERAVRAVAAGEAVFGADVADRLNELFLSHSRRPGASAFPDLDDRELRLLDLVAAGLDNVAIAPRMGLAPKTVRNQVSLLLTKLGVSDRSAAIALARRAGLGRDDSPFGRT